MKKLIIFISLILISVSSFAQNLGELPYASVIATRTRALPGDWYPLYHAGKYYKVPYSTAYVDSIAGLFIKNSGTTVLQGDITLDANGHYIATSNASQLNFVTGGIQWYAENGSNAFFLTRTKTGKTSTINADDNGLALSSGNSGVFNSALTLNSNGVDITTQLTSPKHVYLKTDGVTHNYTAQFPNKSANDTIAMQSDLSALEGAYIKLDGTSAPTTDNIKIGAAIGQTWANGDDGTNYRYVGIGGDSITGITMAYSLSEDATGNYTSTLVQASNNNARLNASYTDVSGSSFADLQIQVNGGIRMQSQRTDSTSDIVILYTEKLTNSREIQFPDTSGTLALLSDIPSGLSLTAASPLSLSMSNVLSIPVGNGSTNGYLSSTNYTNFAAAYAARIATFTTTGSSGAATFTSNTLNIPTYTLSGLGGIGLTSLSGVAPITYNNSTGAIGFDYSTTNVFTGKNSFSGSLTGTGSGSYNIHEITANLTLGASNTFGHLESITGTLTAAANGQTTTGLYIAPTFTNGAFTGLTNNIINAANKFRVNAAGDIYIANFGAAGMVVNDATGKLATFTGTGFVKLIAGVPSADNSTYITGNQTVTLSGDISGSGATAITTAIGAGKVTNTMLAGSIDLTTKVTGVLPAANGGSGVNNGTFTNTLSGNFTTTGAFNPTFAIPRSTTWTLPNTASETLAGLGTAQTFSAINTFTATAKHGIIQTLDQDGVTYKDAFNSTATTGKAVVGGGFSTVTFGTLGQWTFASNNLSFNNTGGGANITGGGAGLSVMSGVNGTTSSLLQLFSSNATNTTGNTFIGTGNATATTGTVTTGNLLVDLGTVASSGTTTRGNMQWFGGTTAVSYNAMQRGLFWGNATAAATGNPTAGIYAWSALRNSVSTTSGLNLRTESGATYIFADRAGFRTLTPNSYLQIGAGDASVAPLTMTSGTVLTTPVAGAREYDGTKFYATPGSVRYEELLGLSGSATYDFPSTAAGAVSTTTITVTGAADGDVVSLGYTNSAANTTGIFSAYVSASNTVTVRFINQNTVTSMDPASGTFTVKVIK